MEFERHDNVLKLISMITGMREVNLIWLEANLTYTNNWTMLWRPTDGV